MLFLSNRMIFLMILSILSIYLSLLLGTYTLTNHDLFAALFDQNASLNKQIIFTLRIPHTISAFIVGGTLGLAGTLIQIMLANPLADPYILGVSGGATVFTLTGMIMGVGGFFLTLLGYLGALITLTFIFVLAHGVKNSSSSRILLMGVMLASGWSAVTSLILALSPSTQFKTLLFWLLGDLDTSQSPYLGLFGLIIGFISSMLIAQKLNVLTLGPLQAKTLGLHTEHLQRFLLILSSFLTATIITMAGPIGFVGLLIPHITRILFPADHRILIPASILLGGSLLTCADILARTLIAPQQLPVGIMTALIGVPTFLYLLRFKYV